MGQLRRLRGARSGRTLDISAQDGRVQRWVANPAAHQRRLRPRPGHAPPCGLRPHQSERGPG